MAGLPQPVAVPASPLGEAANVTSPPLTSREKVATIFAGIILFVIVGISGFLLFAAYVPAPTLAASSSAADQTAAIQQYKALTDVLGDRTVKLFDLLVTKALLPILATLVGFILGKQSQTQ